MAAKVPFLAPNAAVRNVVDAIRSFDEPAVSTGMYFHPNAVGQQKPGRGRPHHAGWWVGRRYGPTPTERLRRKGLEEGRTCAHGGVAEATPHFASCDPLSTAPTPARQMGFGTKEAMSTAPLTPPADRPGG